MQNNAYTTRAARPATYGATHYFTQDSQSLTNSLVTFSSNTGRYSEVPAMSYRKGNSRARYASALYAAALAVLLTACAKTDTAVEQPTSKVTPIHLSESTNTAYAADMPYVVVTAKREMSIY
jgi:hypothetical protein